MIAFKKEAELGVARVWVAAALVVCACSLFAQKSAEEQAVWKLEQAYWEDMKAADMASYLSLWHPICSLDRIGRQAGPEGSHSRLAACLYRQGSSSEELPAGTR